MKKYSSFRLGQIWFDTDGNRIQAQGSVMYIDDTYCWYGENKEKIDRVSDIWHNGIIYNRI